MFEFDTQINESEATGLSPMERLGRGAIGEEVEALRLVRLAPGFEFRERRLVKVLAIQFGDPEPPKRRIPWEVRANRI